MYSIMGCNQVFNIIIYFSQQSFKIGVINAPVWMMKINKVEFIVLPKECLIICPDGFRFMYIQFPIIKIKWYITYCLWLICTMLNFYEVYIMLSLESYLYLRHLYYHTHVYIAFLCLLAFSISTKNLS